LFYFTDVHYTKNKSVFGIQIPEEGKLYSVVLLFVTSQAKSKVKCCGSGRLASLATHTTVQAQKRSKTPNMTSKHRGISLPNPNWIIRDPVAAGKSILC
jgi:hypothetical protein